MRLSLFVFPRLLGLAALLAAAAAPAPAWSKAPNLVKAPAPVRTAAGKGIEPRPAVWLLADEDTKIYLLGTVHVLPPGFRWRSPAIDRIIGEADELVVETYDRPGEDDHRDASAAMSLAKPSSILERVPPRRRKALKAAIGSTGVPIAYFDGLQTWAAAMMLGLAQLLDSYGADNPGEAPGVEDVLEAAFRTAGKPISSVEDPGAVVASLNALPPQAQLDLLLETIAAPNGEPAAASAGGDEDLLWVKGEVEALSARFAKDFPPAMFDALLRSRNRAWARWLAQRLDRPGTVLFAVGAAHLGGADSVREMLAGHGLKVSRVN